MWPGLRQSIAREVPNSTPWVVLGCDGIGKGGIFLRRPNKNTIKETIAKPKKKKLFYC